MATANSRVLFAYVGSGSTLPASPDANTVYFVHDAQELYVGSRLIASHVTADLTPYKVKSVTISGTGNNVSNVAFNESTGAITVTKSNLPTLAKGTDTSGTAKTLSLGGTFTVMTDTAVSNHTITDQNTTFTMPHALTDVTLANKSGTPGTVTMTVTSSDGSVTHTDDVAVFTPSDYIKSSNGSGSGTTLTNASVTLAAAPTSNMQAATKKYVDDAVSGLTGAMHYIGTSTTAITDGGTEAPTIDGTQVPTTNLKAGDVVIYNSLEFIWDGAKWNKLGDDASYVLKTTQVTAGTGLTGGGALNGNVTISHATPGTGSAVTPTSATPSNVTVITGISKDSLGHITGATSGDLTTQINSKIDTKINALNVSAISGDYITSVSESKGKISATAGTKGSVASGNTGLVDGGAVYTAVQGAIATWTVI